MSSEIAAVITEPIMFNGFWSNIQPREGFLGLLKNICELHGSLLIFDEVQTGFRTALGGGQSYFQVTPDLTVFAKAMSGGACLAAFAGSRALMDMLMKNGVVHTGTYNAYPPSVAGALEHLTILAQGDGKVLEGIHKLSAELVSGLQELASNTLLPLQVRSSPGAVTTTFRRDDTKVADYQVAISGLDFSLQQRWHMELQSRGVRITPEGLWYVSAAHTVNDIVSTLKAAGDALNELTVLAEKEQVNA